MTLLQATTWQDYAQSVSGVLTLILGALIGFSLTGLQQMLDRRRRRKSLASALLIELRSLEHIITLRYEDEDAAGSRGTIPTTVFDQFSSDLLLFRHDHLYRLLHFYGFASDIRKHLETARARLANGEELEKTTHDRVRLKAYFALATIGRAKEALEAEGGVLPERLADHGKVVRGLPPAPPPSFENYPTEE